MALGVNDTPSVQFALGAIEIGIAPQVPVPLRLYSESEGIAFETISGWVAPVLWIVRFFVTIWPTAILPNVNEAVVDIVVVGVAVAVGVEVAV